MDSLRQKIVDFNQEIKDIIEEKIRLQKKEKLGCLSDEEKIKLDGILELFTGFRTDAESHCSYISLVMENEEPKSKSFSEADGEWIQKVTGVNMKYRKWTDYVIDETILPGPEFKTDFEKVSKAFHQQYETGRRIYLNLFLSDIILRPEFEETLRIFPNVEVTAVQTNGPIKHKLTGKTDYAIGFAKEKQMFDKFFPREVHLVAAQAKEDESVGDDWKQCVAQAASVHKNRVDACKINTSVWGILSNATTWRFFFIDERSYLWQSDVFILDLRSYEESKVLHIYRLVHYIIKRCYEATALPVSLAGSVS
jgi:hypothetical protein